jgi:predicted nucleic acid-binding protein
VRVTVDASVAVKWLLPESDDEDHVDRALAILRGIGDGALEVLQPRHWLAEVAAVLARLAPGRASEALALLDALELPVSGDLEIYQHAVELAVGLDHHLFDTLYHAVALEHRTTLVTADTRYAAKAAGQGDLIHLDKWRAEDFG